VLVLLPDLLSEVEPERAFQNEGNPGDSLSGLEAGFGKMIPNRYKKGAINVPRENAIEQIKKAIPST